MMSSSSSVEDSESESELEDSELFGVFTAVMSSGFGGREARCGWIC